MKTLIKNSTTGLMIGGVLVFFVCALTNMSQEALQGGALVLCSAIVKSLIS